MVSPTPASIHDAPVKEITIDVAVRDAIELHERLISNRTNCITRHHFPDSDIGYVLVNPGGALDGYVTKITNTEFGNIAYELWKEANEPGKRRVHILGKVLKVKRLKKREGKMRETGETVMYPILTPVLCDDLTFKYEPITNPKLKITVRGPTSATRLIVYQSIDPSNYATIEERIKVELRAVGINDNTVYFTRTHKTETE